MGCTQFPYKNTQHSHDASPTSVSGNNHFHQQVTSCQQTCCCVQTPKGIHSNVSAHTTQIMHLYTRKIHDIQHDLPLHGTPFRKASLCPCTTTRGNSRPPEKPSAGWLLLVRNQPSLSTLRHLLTTVTNPSGAMLHFFPFSTLPTSPTTTILNRIFLNCLEVATKVEKEGRPQGQS